MTDDLREIAWQLTCARTALENWGRHFEWCHAVRNVNMPGPCSCGLTAAIADANSVAVANSVRKLENTTDE